MIATVDFLNALNENFLFPVTDLLIRGLYYAVYLLPFVLIALTWHFYLLYIRSNYIKKEERVLLEIKLPKEITKSPRAMEMLLEVFNQSFEGELVDRFIRGSVRGWFSLELVSLGGEIHFYLQIPKFFQNIVETRIYSQYPEVEVTTVAEDYVKDVDFGQPGTAWDIKGWEYKLSQPDAYPIKTYIDYELEKDPKEEFKIDPMTPLLEFLSSIKPTEQVWVQIIVMAAKKRFRDPKTGKKEDWKKEGKRLVDKLMKRDMDTKDPSSWIKLSLSTGEKDLVTAIERNLDKVGFDVGLRTLYASTTEIKPGIGVGLNSALKQFGSDSLNGFKPVHQTGFDNPWQDPTGWRTKRRKLRHFQYYSNRSYFYPPANKTPITLTTEELATIYHFPGAVATTPTLDRIPSKRGEPPVNLPI